jgi:cell division protein FtsW
VKWRRNRNVTPLQPVQPESVHRYSGTARLSPVTARQNALSAPSVFQRDAHEPDYIILVAVVALCAIGILMVYAASAIPSYANNQDMFALVAPQVLAGLLGLAAMAFFMRLDYRYLRVVSLPLAIVALAMLLVVLVPLPGPLRAMSVTHNGSARWIHLGIIPDVAPAEIAKVAIVVYLSHWLATRGSQIRSLSQGALPFGAIVVPFLLLVIREPDIGTAAVLVVIAFLLYFAAGARFVHFVGAIVVGGVGGIFVMLDIGHYPIERVKCLLDPWADPQVACYQTVQGLKAVSAGGWFGIGLGNNQVSVPYDVNDFIFSVIAQELGLVGGAVVIALFVAFAYAGIRTAIRAPDTFGGLMAAGITAWICFQALINIGVVVAVVPVTGITLPFVSAGGSSLTVSLAAVGILLSVSRETVERGWISATTDSGRGYGRTYIPGSRRRSVASD